MSGLCLLDLTASFDTVDHELLLRRLDRSFGVRGQAKQWLISYLTGRSYCVIHGGRTSSVIQVTCFVPQDSVLGPLLFILYTADLAELASTFGVKLHAFADDNQLRALRPHQCVVISECARTVCYGDQLYDVSQPAKTKC